MTATIAAEIPERIEFDGLDEYVLSEVSDSGAFRIYRSEDDWDLVVVDGIVDPPANELRTTLECYRLVGTDPTMDEQADREDGTEAVRIMARCR